MRTKDARADHFEKNLNQKRDPLFGYVGENLKKYIVEKPLKVGDEMMIYGSHNMMHSYMLVVVEKVDVGRQKRVVVSRAAPWGGRSFYRTGTNCYAPTGQSNLIPVIDWVRDQMGKREEITFSWDWAIKI